VSSERERESHGGAVRGMTMDELKKTMTKLPSSCVEHMQVANMTTTTTAAQAPLAHPYPISPFFKIKPKYNLKFGQNMVCSKLKALQIIFKDLELIWTRKG